MINYFDKKFLRNKSLLAILFLQEFILFYFIIVILL